MNKQIIRELVSNINGATFVSIDYTTDVTLAGGKMNPFQGRVQKQIKGASVMAFANKNSNGYSNMVKRRLENEGKNPESFVLGPRKWGTRVVGAPLVEHNDDLYLEVIFLTAGEKTMLVDGQPSTVDIPGIRESSNGEQGGLDNKVIIRTINVANIKGITIDKQRFEDRS